MNNLIELKQDRSEILAKLEAIDALASGRALNSNEKREYNKYKDELLRLDSQIDETTEKQAGAQKRVLGKRLTNTKVSREASAKQLRPIIMGASRGEVEFNPSLLVSRFGTPESGSMGNVTGTYVNTELQSQAQSDLGFLAEFRMVPAENNTRFPYVKRSDRVTAAKKGYSDSLSDTDYVVSAVTSSFNNLYVSLAIHNDTRRDDVVGLDMTVQSLAFQDIQQQMAYDVLFADGTGNAVTGVKSITGVQATDHGTAAVADWTPIIESYRKLLEKNVNKDNIACVMHPLVWEQFTSLADSTGQPLQMPKQIENLRFYVNSKIDIDEGAGSNESRIFIGDFSKFDLLVDREYTVFSNSGPTMKKDATDFLFTFRYDLQTIEPDHMLMLHGITVS